MSNIDNRIDLAVGWLTRSQIHDGHGGAGWGWVSDVPPNPQNTAEVVVALHSAGRALPNREAVRALIRRHAVGTAGGEWHFRSPIDLSWRLRALHCMGVVPSDPDVVECLTALCGEQDADTGGWWLAGPVGPVSVTATTSAVHALVDIAAVHESAAQALLRGTSLLVSMMLDDDPRIRPLYAYALTAYLLARPEIAGVGGKRVDQVRTLVVDRLLDGLRRGTYPVEEEPFRRGETADTWRHLSLHLAVGAVVAADDRTIFDPGVRRGLVDLLDLQETEPMITYRGGFRTSPEGFVTSYATVQGLEAMNRVRKVVNERVSPAKVFDLICRVEGAHPADAQELVAVRGRSVVMNSYSGAAVLGATGLSGLTIAILGVMFAGDLGEIGSRALVVWGTLFLALGAFTGVATRLASVTKTRIATAVFAAYTAVVLPVVTFLLS